MAVTASPVAEFILQFVGVADDEEKKVLGFYSEVCINNGSQGNLVLALDEVVKKEEEGEGLGVTWKAKVTKEVYDKKWKNLLQSGGRYRVRAAIEVWTNGGSKGVFYKILRAEPISLPDVKSQNGLNFKSTDDEEFQQLEHLVNNG